MLDTTPEMHQKMIEMMQKKSPSERVAMGSSMYETSKYLIIRSILEKNPQISNADLVKEFFLAFYRNDFSPAELENIIEHLQQHSNFCR
jgi:hypothetical protein